ncbi:hypothetical protein PAXRUDRAFT_830994 [Paxillus rubicundulus Ve08.2h10]|uniref:Telomere-associated protein Rif1 N-terminal domain-containing protein n=1 Tax=Paxillus rubicundulus Ve08.2h10 TaxID=930991 RepID=A0A0D0D414_9AGAM|nr:hypothetical protein PAXRUDRAFT_830994 [Paxillus rubicundulus Ve08.2h10]
MSVSLVGIPNNLEDPSYLLSAVETVTDSFHEHSSISTHDLLDAYSTFSSRIRSQSQVLQDGNRRLPSLDCLRDHKDTFIRALRRDVCVAHINSFSTFSPSPLSSDEAMSGGSIHANIGIDTKQHARNSSLLCVHALCALATVFRFPALHYLFTVQDLYELLGDVLGIALADQLPVLNSAKIYSLSLWILGCHRLPCAVLSARHDEMISALRRSLKSARQLGSFAVDGLKAISHTLEQHPSGFFVDLLPLLPYVMQSLLDEPSDIRLHASIALGTFANTLVNQRESLLAERQTASDHVISFLQRHCDDTQASPSDMCLSFVVRTAFSAELQTRPGEGPTWILAVLASLIVLSGPSLYSNSIPLQFILQSLALALTHRRSVVRSLHSHVWKCFVWTFGQMLLSPKNTDPASTLSALYVIKQELGRGVGTALTTVLLGPLDWYSAPKSGQGNDRITQALSVIQAMVRTDCKHTRQEGFVLLRALTTGIGDANIKRWVPERVNDMLALALFNGTIICAGWERIPSIVHSISILPEPAVRQLHDTEIVLHCETLLDMWKHCALKASEERLDPGLIDMWRSILLAHLHCGQGAHHLTATTNLLRHATTIIVDFLPPSPLLGSQRDWGSWSVQDQLGSLTAIDQLWSLLQNVFSSFSLSEPAEIIITSILKFAFHILDHEVQALWSRLCANLMTTASPSFLGRMHSLTESQLVLRTRREFWGVVGKSLSCSEPSLHWKEVINFLAIPVCAWVLSGPELEVWEALLHSAVTSADGSAIVIDGLMQHFQGKDVENWGSALAVLCIIFGYSHREGRSPSADLLSTVDAVLSVSYSRAADSPELLGYSLRLLVAVRDGIVSAAPAQVMHIVLALRNSLPLWIEDRIEVMSINDFNSVVISLYCETLKVLETLPLSIRSLQEMESFLASAFSRIPTPAIAPFAFEKFWRASCHGQGQINHILPPKIKSCLASFVAAYGGDLADGLSLPTESQSQIISNGIAFSSHTSGQISGESNPFDILRPSSKDDEIWSERFDAEITPQAQEPTLPGPKDATFLVASSDDEVFQPSALRQLHEYSSRVNSPSMEELDRSTSDRRGPSPRICPRPRRLLTPHPSARSPPATPQIQQRKRERTYRADPPRKRSRTSSDYLRSLRKIESEPITRDITPIMFARAKSLPTKSRKIFDGVEVLTLREVLRRDKAERVRVGEKSLSFEQEPSFVQRMCFSPLPSSVGSDEEVDIDDWEKPYIEAILSEIEIGKSLADAYPSSPPPSQSSAAQEPNYEPRLTSGSNLRQTRSQSEESTSVPTDQPLRRSKTSSARLQALRGVYASMADGASQIPMSELLQATRLVHKIGAVLTEQMGKKVGDLG